jgi:hypothetical protein
MLCNDHGMLYNLKCYIMYVSVVSHPLWCITYPNSYITGYITCCITSFATYALQSSALSSSAGSRSSRRRFSVTAARRRTGLIESRIARIARRQIRRIAPNREALYKNPNREARCISENASVKVDLWSFVAL